MGEENQVSGEVRESTSTDTQRLDMEAIEAGMQYFCSGKKSFALKEFTKATEELQLACQKLAHQYGEKDECLIEPYYYYGKSLIEIVRMEADVLGNALSGVDQEKLRADKSPAEDEQTEESGSATGVTEEEKEHISEMVIDAMTSEKRDVDEKDVDSKEGDSAPKGDETASPEEKGSKDVSEKEKSISPEKTGSPKETTPEKNDSPMKTATPEKNDLPEDAASEKSVTPENATNPEKTVSSDNAATAEKTVSSENAASPEKTVSPLPVTSEVSEKTTPSDEGEVKEEKSDVREEEEEMDTEDADAGQTENGKVDKKTGDDADSEHESGKEDSEDVEDEVKSPEEDSEVSNNQVAWEVLDLARLILERNESKSKRLRLADVHMALAEVAIENSQFNQALTELQKALSLRTGLLETNSRLIAETHFQVGVVHAYLKCYEKAVASTRQAAEILKACIEGRVGSSQTDIDSLKEVLKEVEAKAKELENDVQQSEAPEVEDKENVLPSETPVTSIIARKKGESSADTSPTSKKRQASDSAEPEEAKKPKTDLAANKPLLEL